jgi:hypothetical protein
LGTLLERDCVKVLLRHQPTGLYVLGRESWTGSAEEAFVFKGMREAVHFAEESRLSRMELAIVSERPRHLTAVPVSALTCRFPPSPTRWLRPT